MCCKCKFDSRKCNSKQKWNNGVNVAVIEKVAMWL